MVKWNAWMSIYSNAIWIVIEDGRIENRSISIVHWVLGFKEKLKDL